jgi:hypothetical protein
MVESAEPLCTSGGRPPGTLRVADCHSLKGMGFLLFGSLRKEQGLSHRLEQWGVWATGHPGEAVLLAPST